MDDVNEALAAGAAGDVAEMVPQDSANTATTTPAAEAARLDMSEAESTLDGNTNTMATLEQAKSTSVTEDNRTTPDLEHRESGLAAISRSTTAAAYENHMDDMEKRIAAQREENRKNIKKKELVFGPAVIWYLAKRYRCTKTLTWSQYIRHFLPYPLITLSVMGLQFISLLLLRLDTEPEDFEDIREASNIQESEEAALLFARLASIAILTAYILMTGRSLQNFIHVIAFDAIFQKTPYFYLYLILPIAQGLIEAFAIYISSLIILTSGTIIDVFKDVVAVMFLMEIDQWMANACNMMDLGLDADSLVIDFSNDDSNLDELIVTIVYGSLLVLRFGIISWAVWNTMYGTLGNEEDVL